MTLETVLLLAVYVFLVAGTFFGPSGLTGTFKKSTPVLAGKIERDLTTSGFKESPNQWAEPLTGINQEGKHEFY